MRHDVLSDVLSQVMNAERIGRPEVVVYPVSSLVKNVLTIMKNLGYIGDFEYIDDNRGGKIKVKLIGKINKCNSIKPRFSTSVEGLEKYEQRYLPAKDFGVLIMSTTSGMMTHHDCKKKNVGGVLVAYVY
jgi:small subunit ribosomal protein S8